MFYRIVDFVPSRAHFLEHLAPERGDVVVFARWSFLRLFPFVGEFVLFAHTVEERVERAFHHYHVCVAERADDVGGICPAFGEEQQDAVFEHSLAHLRLDVVYACFIHVFSVLRYAFGI